MSDSNQQIKIRLTSDTKQVSQSMTQATAKADALSASLLGVGDAAKSGGAAVVSAAPNITAELAQTLQQSIEVTASLEELEQELVK